MRRMLVTGGAGFIGSHLCERLLAMGFHVVCLDNFNDSYDPALKRKNIEKALSNPRYTLIEGDIRDSRLLDEILAGTAIDTVFHLAALAGVRRSISSPLEYIDIDIGGTVKMLEAGKKNGIKKFVFASSSSVYGINHPPFRETDPLTGQTSPYAVAKYSGELYCKMYSEAYPLSSVCLRFFTVYGPRQRPDMAVHMFTKAVLEGGGINIYGDGSSSRDYTYIDDVIDGIIAAAELDCSFETFNLGSARPVGIMDLIRTIEGAAGKKADISFLPVQPGDVPETFADIGKASSVLGYTPKIGITEGIERFVDWYSNHLYF